MKTVRALVNGADMDVFFQIGVWAWLRMGILLIIDIVLMLVAMLMINFSQIGLASSGSVDDES